MYYGIHRTHTKTNGHVLYESGIAQTQQNGTNALNILFIRMEMTWRMVIC